MVIAPARDRRRRIDHVTSVSSTASRGQERLQIPLKAHRRGQIAVPEIATGPAHSDTGATTPRTATQSSTTDSAHPALPCPRRIRPNRRRLRLRAHHPPPLAPSSRLRSPTIHRRRSRRRRVPWRRPRHRIRCRTGQIRQVSRCRRPRSKPGQTRGRARLTGGSSAAIGSSSQDRKGLPGGNRYSLFELGEICDEAAAGQTSIRRRRRTAGR